MTLLNLLKVTVDGLPKSMTNINGSDIICEHTCLRLDETRVSPIHHSVAAIVKARERGFDAEGTSRGVIK